MKSTRPSTRKDKYLIFVTIIAIFLIAGGIVVALKACGGDEPAPVALTSADTVSTATTPAEPLITKPAPAETATAEATTPGPSQSAGDIRSVDWPSVTGAAASSSSSDAATKGFVESVLYQDLTGDGSEEALVLVRQPGSGAHLGYFIYTMEAGDPVMLFERQNVSHGKVELGTQAGSFVETEPVYGPQDPNCCPSNLRVTTYTWSAASQTFVQTASKLEPAPQT
ncbi:MAG: hypothetical protein ACYCW5_02450 [Thermoleophilia bacterium]